MRLFVTVKPRSKKEGVLKIDDAHFIVRLHARPVEGRANDALIRMLADYFGVPQSRISIVAGARSRKKAVEIL